MPIRFKQETRTSSYLDPFSGFTTTEREVTIREDPLTGAVSRLFGYRRRPPQQISLGPDGGYTLCAFCKENIEAMTPRFPPELCPEGRIRRGEAVVFPNLFPYDGHNAVAAMSERHEVSMGEWPERALSDALLACREYIARVVRSEEKTWFHSVNWNYTPIAGASQIHPHLQILVSPTPTREMARLLEASRSYAETHGSSYWNDLLRVEQEAGERYLGRSGSARWLVNFASKGFVPDVTAVMVGDGDFVQSSDRDVEDLAAGLLKVLRYYDSRRIGGLNLTLYSLSPGRPDFATHARVVPRFRIPPLNISDVNYFRLMHDEGLCMVSPEHVCGELSRFFERD